MEEDIKILEEFLVGNKYCKNCTEKCVDCYIEYEEVQAVARLIKGYRELEEENEGLKLDRRNLLRGIERITQTTPLNMRTETNYSINIDNNTIPKSKIKEKIEPVIDSLEKDGFVGYADELRDIMSELMEDK